MACINLQWHITNKCNLRCKHCYQESYQTPDLDFDNYIKILNQFEELIKKLDEKSNGKKFVRITLTGGEPFSSKNFFPLIKYIKKALPYVRLSILTNGTMINTEMARFLTLMNLHFVQVSLEGTKKTHDSIRGNGSFDEAVNGIKKLVSQNIKVTISFTAHKNNYLEFPRVVKIAKKLKVFSIWSDRMIPDGNAQEMKDYLLTPEETKNYIYIMAKEKKKKSLFNKTIVSTERALQFAPSNSSPYFCKAGRSLITVDEKANLMPCRRMPIVAGNLLENNLSDLYFNNEVFKALRKDTIPQGCIKCSFKNKCKGGLKCLSYSLNQDFNLKDPGCWM